MTYVAEPHHSGNALRCTGQLHEACRLHREPLQNIRCVSNHLRYTAAACGLNDIRCLPNLLRLHGLLLHGKGCRAGHSISLQGRLHQFNFHFRGPPDIPALRPGGSFLLLLSQDCEMYSPAHAGGAGKMTGAAPGKRLSFRFHIQIFPAGPGSG